MTEERDSHAPQRSHVGVHFKCCNVYSHIYMNHDKTAYAGHCPKCASRIEIPIVKEGGSSDKFFTGS
ncbi:hypothetical protein [Gimesia aquarii]|uniref:Uncharacterized protein n=1 Tax=Gimesia aquarii TaxID=2527964 RepID=A0A517VWL0_9PLAN|nr:hypothetical protein [Gimesia aquarii]QDT97389.1 hypothetical protein V144x_28640 [Gimesia aquarii]